VKGIHKNSGTPLTSREKNQITYTGKSIKITADLSTANLKTRRA
jgi:hypothetical protein